MKRNSPSVLFNDPFIEFICKKTALIVEDPGFSVCTFSYLFQRFFSCLFVSSEEVICWLYYLLHLFRPLIQVKRCTSSYSTVLVGTQKIYLLCFIYLLFICAHLKLLQKKTSSFCYRLMILQDKDSQSYEDHSPPLCSI